MLDGSEKLLPCSLVFTSRFTKPLNLRQHCKYGATCTFFSSGPEDQAWLRFSILLYTHLYFQTLIINLTCLVYSIQLFVVNTAPYKFSNGSNLSNGVRRSHWRNLPALTAPAVWTLNWLCWRCIVGARCAHCSPELEKLHNKYGVTRRHCRW